MSLIASPIAIEDGTRFAIREGGRTVGAGAVTKIVNRVTPATPGFFLFEEKRIFSLWYNGIKDVSEGIGIFGDGVCVIIFLISRKEKRSI